MRTTSTDPRVLGEPLNVAIGRLLRERRRLHAWVPLLCGLSIGYSIGQILLALWP